MKLLKDDELVDLIRGPNPIIRGFDEPADWYSKVSLVQASSIDLHVGNIFLPGAKEGEPGSESKPLKEHILEAGHTAIVTTLEELIIPGHIAGIGFPPTSVSSRGILMTNPGHVDPGYKGFMSFTVINMGKKDYPLRRNDIIVTLLLFELSAPASKDWSQRYGVKPAEAPIQENLDMLSIDFMDFENRATEIAKQEVKKADLRIKWWGILTPILGVVIAALIALLPTIIIPAWKEPLEKVDSKFDKKVAVFERSLDLANIKTRIDEIERRLKKAKKTTQSSDTTQDVRSQDTQDKQAGQNRGDRQ